MTIWNEQRFHGPLEEIRREAERSIAKHGEQHHLPMGTGPHLLPLAARNVEQGSLHSPGMWPGMSASHLATIATLDTKSHSANEGGDDTCSWWLILREEVFEAAAEDDPAKLRAEMVQVAAVALKMIDALDAVGSAESSSCHHMENVTVDAWARDCIEGECEHITEEGEGDIDLCPAIRFRVCVDCMAEAGAGRDEEGWDGWPLEAWPHPGSTEGADGA